MTEHIAVLGIDQGKRFCGYALVAVEGTNIKVQCHGVANLNTKTGRSEMREAFARAGSIKAMGYATERPFRGASHQANSNAVYGMRIQAGQNGALGMLTIISDEFGVRRLKPVPPAAAKKALTGYGAASKELMIWAASQLFRESFVEHDADAVAIAKAAIRRYQQEQLQQGWEKRALLTSR